MVNYKDHSLIVGIVIMLSIPALLFGTATGTLTVIAKTVEIRSDFVREGPNNLTTFNGTINRLEGTNEEIIQQYLELGEQFDEKSGIKPGESVTFVFKNNTNVTVPHTGYENPVSMDLINEILETPVTEEGAGTICWLYYEDRNGQIWQQHYVCSWGPMYPP